MPPVTPVTRAQVFASNLWAAMERQNISRRELAKRIDPDDPEQGRHAVRRALRGVHEPTPATVQRYADALEDVTPEELLPEDDEAEAAPDMARLMRDLNKQLRLVQKAQKRLSGARA